MDPEPPKRGRLSRRTFLAGAAGAGVGIAAGAGVVAGIDRGGGSSAPGASADTAASQVVPFRGEHQAGIATAVQERLYFGAFDLTTQKRDDVSQLLKTWTAAAERMCAGEPAADIGTDQVPAPADSGEALGLAPARLTVTIGLGPTLFQQDGRDRYGLAALRPQAFVDIPPFATDALDPAICGGDLCVQACADDPVVAFHAVRNLARLAQGVAVLRWSQAGFGRTSSTTRAQTTERNLMGFKDGTNNIKAEDAAAMTQDVWVADETPAWMRGGSYMITRRIRIRIEAWDADSLGDQERRVGRAKESGAPLGADREFDPVDLNATVQGRLVIPENAHIRVASPQQNHGARILRRGYSFSDRIDGAGEIDAGLFFICFQRDPATQFIAIQAQLAKSDALSLYLVHTGSAIFACPPGASAGGYVGETLLG